MYRAVESVPRLILAYNKCYTQLLKLAGLTSPLAGRTHIRSLKALTNSGHHNSDALIKNDALVLSSHSQ